MSLIPCPNCGQMISDRARNCPKCGCHLSQSNAEDEPTAHNLGNQPVEEVTPPENAASCDETEEFYNETKSRKKVWFIVLLALIVVTAGCVALFRYKSSDKATQTPAEDGSVAVAEEKADTEFITPDLAFNELHGKVSKVQWISTEDMYNPKSFIYDEEGNMAPVQQEGWQSFNYYRNDKGQVIQIDDPNQDADCGSRTFYEWIDGRVASSLDGRFNDNPDIDKNQYRTIYHYDEKGLLKELTREKDSFEDEGEVRNFKVMFSDYEFDDNGNWISRNSAKTYELLDYYGENPNWQKCKSTGKEYRIIWYHGQETPVARSIKEVQRDWEMEQGY